MKNATLPLIILFSLYGLNGSAAELSPAAYRLDLRMRRFGPEVFSAPLGNDLAANLVGSLNYRSLSEMDSAGLSSGHVSVNPWSDSYWPTFRGLTADRYADGNYSPSSSWQSNVAWLLDNIGRGDVDRFSPAEKYDLLVGDSTFTLTHNQLSQGESAFSTYGTVPDWVGICHGWAAAAFMLPRPRNSVNARAADGTEIHFYPSDIKALGDLLWANGLLNLRFISGRCDISHPATDGAGRPLSSECLDTNPGTWHLAIVNMMAQDRPFIMDATYDLQVWNQPVIGYSYRYFNPRTRQRSSDLSGAIVRLGEYRNDPFASVRAVNATAVAGVAMTVTYVAETAPLVTDSDDASSDRVVTTEYLYDLELDGSGNIVGGEWYESEHHPDFLWAPVPGSRALAYGDSRLGGESWEPSSSFPESWRSAAKSSSSSGQPLAHVVEALFSESAR